MDGRRFEVILNHQTVAFSLCAHLPVPFLRLRAASRSTLMPISIQMRHRIVLLKKHRLEEVRHNLKPMDSGIMVRLLHCEEAEVTRLLRHCARCEEILTDSLRSAGVILPRIPQHVCTEAPTADDIKKYMREINFSSQWKCKTEKPCPAGSMYEDIDFRDLHAIKQLKTYSVAQISTLRQNGDTIAETTERLAEFDHAKDRTPAGYAFYMRVKKKNESQTSIKTEHL